MKRIALVGALIVVAAIVAASLLRRADAAAPHERAALGECASCHDEAPRHHREREWDLAHGHVGPELAGRCRTCHEPRTCIACHERAPASHTDAFLRPVAETSGAGLHAVLGGAHPAACVVCHQAPARECSGCHRGDETRSWIDDADDDLERWRDLLEGR
ncbi:MAG: hypothetical protein DRJ42_16695 [Deltaproteobacteria bacterium]|nr:MAG: hypothetical protein DRJ42_16695 [Deltaproteobacteria bacterium]